MQVVQLKQIRETLKRIDVLEEVAAGFVAYSRDEAVVPPVGELAFKNPPGDDDDITVADLTGVAVQDIQIATAVVRALGS